MATFNREYRFKAFYTETMSQGDGAKMFELGKRNEDGYAPHIQFSFERTDSTVLNQGKISLWNLNNEQLEILYHIGCQIQLRAGYVGEKGDATDSLWTIFEGSVVNAQTELDGGSYKTELTVIDGFHEGQNGYVSRTYKTEITPFQVINDVADYSGYRTKFTEIAKNWCQNKAKMANGYVAFGTVADVLKKVANLANCRVTICNGFIQVFTEYEVLNADNAYKLNAKTGLIRIPKRIYSSAVTAGEYDTSTISDSVYGYEISFLMNGAIEVNDIIVLESKRVTGVFRIFNLTISGDNYGGDWQCKAKVCQSRNVSNEDKNGEKLWTELKHYLGWREI